VDRVDTPVVTDLVRPGEIRHGPADVRSIVLDAFDAHAGRLKAFALRAVRDADAADDIVQDTFERLLAAVRGGSTPDDVGSWLFTVCGNLIVSRGRRRSVATRMASLLADRRQVPSPEERAVRADDNARLTAALDDLPTDARVALLMSAAGYTSAEIGRVIGRTENATLSYVCRARIRLRDALAKLEESR
jgi:RNA polymerase sigma factor (sigma-70 family)